MNLEEMSENLMLLEIARKAIEDRLIELRDSRLSMLGRGNGLVIREEDGSNSYIIRMGPETAVSLGLKAIAKYLKDETNKNFQVQSRGCFGMHMGPTCEGCAREAACIAAVNKQMESES